MRDGDFRIRGKEISRVEGLSDAVFGFSITLLIVSLEVPKRAEEVLHAMRGFFAFAMTFALLFSVWRIQFKFFRRFGLEDDTTVWLNAALLFVILFFVYPLKFVVGAIVERLLTHAGFPDPTAPNLFKDPLAGLLMVVYSMGLGAVFSVFALLHRHALSKREELQLDELEVFDTENAMQGQIAAAVMGYMVALLNAVAYVMPDGKGSELFGYVAMAVVLVFFTFSVRRRRARRTARKALIVRRQSHAAVVP